jgi:RecA-family ATPase
MKSTRKRREAREPTSRTSPSGKSGTDDRLTITSTDSNGTEPGEATQSDELPGAVVELLSRLPDVHANGSGFIARCPICGEPEKFTIAVGDEKPVIFNCFRDSCNALPSELAEAVGLDESILYDPTYEASPEAREAFGKWQRSPHARTKEPVPLPSEGAIAGWHKRLLADPGWLAYLTDARGLDVATIEEHQIGWDGERFTIPIREDGEVVNLRRYSWSKEPKMKGLAGHSASLFPLPYDEDHHPDEWVVLCEGEWDRLLARQNGLCAITGTAGTTFKVEWAEHFQDRRVAIVYDVGADGSRTAEKLADEAAEVRVVDLARKGLHRGEDLTDWFLRYDYSADDLRRLIASQDPDDDLDERAEIAMALAWEEDAERDHLQGMLTEADISRLPAPEWLVREYFPAEGVAVIWGQPGIGKTLLMIHLAKCVVRGGRWHSRKAKRGGVLFYEGEGLGEFKPRLEALDAYLPKRKGAAAAPILFRDGTVDLNDARQVAAVVRTARSVEQDTGERVRLIVIEPLIESMSGEENAEGMDQASRALRWIAQEVGCCVVVAHHSNASGERARGNDKLRARVHSMFRMERTDGNRLALVGEKQRNGERFAMEYEMLESRSSVVLEMRNEMHAIDYERNKAQHKAQQKVKRDEEKATAARDLIREALETTEGPLTQNELDDTAYFLAKSSGKDVGQRAIRAARTEMVNEGEVVVERGKNKSRLHRLAGDHVGT